MSSSIQKLTTLPARAISSFNKAPGEDVQCEGWLLKKRRRKQQGYARRYFVLRSSGVLSYALHSQLSPREQFSLSTAAISSSSTRREIHFDCENGVYHVKATSLRDFEMWMAAFRKFIHVTGEGGTVTKKVSMLRSPIIPTTLHINKLNTTLDQMGISLQNLEDAVKTMKLSEKRASSQSKLKKDSMKDKEGLRHMFRRTSSSATPQLSGGSPVHPSDFNVEGSSVAHQIQNTVELLRQQFDHLCVALTHPDFALMSTTMPRSESPNSPKTTLGRRRDSDSTYLSGDTNSITVWFDAPEGPEEFVIADDNSTPSSDISDTYLDSSDSADSMASMETADEGDTGDEGSSGSDHTCRSVDTAQVVRRSILPAPVSGDEVSLFQLLRRNIGKDLSTISFPVTSNEPLGLLQRLAEDLEYAELVSQACAASNPTERMCLVAAFAVSGFACTRLRSGRKPFTPMLGETYEDTRTRFIAEKVSNQPLVIASHAEGEGWEWWATNAGKNHFWGKSLEIEQTGTTHLKIGKDHYQWSKPSCFIRNLVVGTKYLEHVGSLSIKNIVTGASCEIEFKESGYWGTPNVVSGIVYSTTGTVETRLEGIWHEQLSQVIAPSHLRVLWRANPFPKHASLYYGLTSFATTLNEITPDIVDRLPPTDTRYRPDLRALEEGNVSLAETEKLRVEVAQRERRNHGEDVQPKWFKKLGPEEYVYNGGYWEQRVKGWTGCPNLW